MGAEENCPQFKEKLLHYSFHLSAIQVPSRGTTVMKWGGGAVRLSPFSYQISAPGSIIAIPLILCIFLLTHFPRPTIARPLKKPGLLECTIRRYSWTDMNLRYSCLHAPVNKYAQNVWSSGSDSSRKKDLRYNLTLLAPIHQRPSQWRMRSGALLNVWKPSMMPCSWPRGARALPCGV